MIMTKFFSDCGRLRKIHTLFLCVCFFLYCTHVSCIFYRCDCCTVDMFTYIFVFSLMHVFSCVQVLFIISLHYPALINGLSKR